VALALQTSAHLQNVAQKLNQSGFVTTPESQPPARPITPIGTAAVLYNPISPGT
jgi:hypothetical protein